MTQIVARGTRRHAARRLETTRAISVTVPASPLLRAAEVIE
jgi:hypothetical protein